MSVTLWTRGAEVIRTSHAYADNSYRLRALASLRSRHISFRVLEFEMLEVVCISERMAGRREVG